MLSSDETVLYTVVSDDAVNARTTIYRGETQEIVAIVKRKTFRPDRIKFGAEATIVLSSWLKGASGKWSDL